MRELPPPIELLPRDEFHAAGRPERRVAVEVGRRAEDDITQRRRPAGSRRDVAHLPVRILPSHDVHDDVVHPVDRDEVDLCAGSTWDEREKPLLEQPKRDVDHVERARGPRPRIADDDAGPEYDRRYAGEMLADDALRLAFGLLVRVEEPLSHLQLVLGDDSRALARDRRRADVDEPFQSAARGAPFCDREYAPRPSAVHVPRLVDRMIEPDRRGAVYDVRCLRFERGDLPGGETEPFQKDVSAHPPDPLPHAGNSLLTLHAERDRVHAGGGVRVVISADEKRDDAARERPEEPGNELRPHKSCSARHEYVFGHRNSSAVCPGA